MAKDHHPPPLHVSEKPFSLLQQNDLFVNKILSRPDSSFGRSARLPACCLPGRIPFNWEAQPGLPKHHSSAIPPPADLPPPAAAGSNTTHVVPKPDPVYKVWFLKKPMKRLRSGVVKQNGAFGSSSSRRHVVRESASGRKLNDESSLSCVTYSLSRSSSLPSSSNGYGRRRFKLGSLVKGFIRWAF